MFKIKYFRCDMFLKLYVIKTILYIFIIIYKCLRINILDVSIYIYYENIFNLDEIYKTEDYFIHKTIINFTFRQKLSVEPHQKLFVNMCRSTSTKTRQNILKL